MQHLEIVKDDMLEKQNTVLAMITHDLKSPMVAITGASDFLMEILLDTPNPELLDQDILKNIKMIQSAGKDMLELISQILLMAREETGREPIDPIRVDDLNGKFNHITDTFRYQASINNITMAIEIEPCLPDVYWDINKIHYHVINNIISNALKYTPAGGRILFSASVDKDSVLIKISDNGPGISEIDRKRIFNPYERLMSISERVYHSAGLGLYNAHLFVSKHNGSITVSDGLDGKGSCFTVKLPPQPYLPNSST